MNDLDIVYDQRVLVDHVGKGSASRLDDWQGLWARNRRRFLDKWMGDGDGARASTRVDPERFARNREIARAVAGWMERYFTMRDREDRRNRRFFAKHGPVRTHVARLRARGAGARSGRKLPARLANRLGRRGRGASSSGAVRRARRRRRLRARRSDLRGPRTPARAHTGHVDGQAERHRPHGDEIGPATVTMRNGRGPEHAARRPAVIATDPLGARTTMR